MNNLQNEIYTHIAIYNDGAKDYLTEKEYNIIFNESSSEADGTWIKGKYIRLSNIARIIPVSEYQEKYKKELPATIPNFPYEHLLPKPKYERVKALKSMIRGFKSTCTEGNPMLPMMERTLRRAELEIN